MTPAIPILMYHAIGDASARRFRRWVVPEGQFEREMASINDEGCTALTVSDLVRHMRAGTVPPRPVAVTFDDGFADFGSLAMPILDRYHVPATLYVVSGYVGSTSRWLGTEGEGRRPMLDWEELRALAGQGIEIGGHTRTHPQLDAISLASASSEIRGSRQDLEDHLGIQVRSFAYPHGYHNGAVRRLVVESGFDSSCAVKHAMSHGRDDVFALARIIVEPGTPADTMRAWLRGEGLSSVRPGEGWATRGWRVARRLRGYRHPGKRW